MTKNKKNWDTISNEEFEALDVSTQQDWKDLRDRVNRRYFRP